jgi:two-component system sensor histidine kinase RegB
LKQLSEAAAEVRDSRLEIISVKGWLQRLRESTTLLWPAADIQWDTDFPVSRITVDATLDQAVLNIIANALRESPDFVRIGALSNNGTVILYIQDHGQGLDDKGIHPPGSTITESESGLGIGLFLSNATIQRLGGTLSAELESTGVTMNIELPEAPHAD